MVGVSSGERTGRYYLDRNSAAGGRVGRPTPRGRRAAGAMDNAGLCPTPGHPTGIRHQTRVGRQASRTPEGGHRTGEAGRRAGTRGGYIRCAAKLLGPAGAGISVTAPGLRVMPIQTPEHGAHPSPSELERGNPAGSWSRSAAHLGGEGDDVPDGWILNRRWRSSWAAGLPGRMPSHHCVIASWRVSTATWRASRTPSPAPYPC